jgi:hypothetical protein
MLRIASRVGAGSDKEVEVEGKTAMDLYVTLGPLACSVRVCSSSDGLGRPRGLGGQLRE